MCGLERFRSIHDRSKINYITSEALHLRGLHRIQHLIYDAVIPLCAV